MLFDKVADKRDQLSVFYKSILIKYTELLGEVPSFLNLFSDELLIEPSVELKYESGFTICAVENLKTKFEINIKNIRSIKSHDNRCCPDSSLKLTEPCFCECDCSPNKNRKMYRVPLLSSANSNKVIALACFSISGELDPDKFDPTNKFKSRIKEVSQFLSQYLQNGIQSYMEAQESSLLEKQGKLLTEIKGTESPGLIVELLKVINNIMGSKICTFLWKEDDHLNILGTSIFEYYFYDKNGVKRHDTDFDEKFEDFSVSYDLDSMNFTPRVAKLARPISIEKLSEWQKIAGVDRRTKIPYEDGAFLGVPISYQKDRDVIGVLRCSVKEKGKYKFFDLYDTELLTRIGKSITPLLISIKDNKSIRSRTRSAAHEIRNYTHLFMHNTNKEFNQYTPKNISDIAHLIQLCTDDFQTQIPWNPNKDRTKWPSLHSDIIAPAIHLTNLFLSTKQIEKYSSPDVIHFGWKQQFNPHLKVDTMRVIQIIFNLLNNALKYSQKDSSGNYPGDYHSFEKSKIHVVPYKNDGVISIDIINNGHRINEDEKLKIFNQGYRGNKAKEKALGNGMGLHICKHITTEASKKQGEGAIKLKLSSTFNPVVFSLVFDLNKLNRRY